jgi:purine-binding chemotaxis protein CheW
MIVIGVMPRLRRKTPHEPVHAIPAPVERGAAALPRSGRQEAPSLRALAIALNDGQPRPKTLDMELPAFEDSAPPAPVTPLRERLASREGRAELLVFRVGRELFAIELRAVEEAVEGVHTRSIPDAPPSMLGIFALRDRTLPMYGLARVLDIAHSGDGEMTLVLRPSSVRIALAVDGVDDVFDVALDAVRPPPAGESESLVLGVVWRETELVTLLDADVVVAACLAAAPLETP